MKKILFSLLAAFVTANALAQPPQVEGQMPIDGIPYFLPKTELHFKVLVEHTHFTPGEYAMYGERLLKKKCSEAPADDYRIIGLSMYATSSPDADKEFILYLDKKRTIYNADRTADGILLAINAHGTAAPLPPADYEPSGWRATHPDPRDYMNEAILSAGSTVKMAELTAREIYDIRESRNLLSRGQAEYNPTDNGQLQTMLRNLDKQEAVLLQAFAGYTDKDTAEVKFDYTPQPGTPRQLLFRFSKKLGVVDNDDLSGAPYYIQIDDLGLIPEIQTEAEGMKPIKDDPGVVLNMPGKIRVSIVEMNKPIKQFELYAAQYGRLETLSTNLFSTKFTSHIVLDPLNGNVVSIETEPLGKK